MDIQTLIKEIKRFLFDNKKIILLSISVVVIVVGLLQLATYFLGSQTNESDINEMDSLHTASFEIYIEQNNLGAFTNSYLIEAYLKQDDIVSEIEKKSNLSIAPVIDEYNETNEVITTSDEDPINVSRNTSTNIMTVSFAIGTEEENLKAAETYYEWLKTAEHSFFEDKTVFYMSEPKPIDTDVLANHEASFSVRNLIIRLVLALFGGLILGIVIALAIALFNKKIMYAFTYGWNEEDLFLNYSENDNSTEIAHSIVQPSIGIKVILSEKILNKDLSDSLGNMLSSYGQLNIHSNVSEIDPALAIDEFIIVIKRKETTKLWYQNQRRQLKSYRSSRIKIVQI